MPMEEGIDLLLYFVSMVKRELMCLSEGLTHELVYIKACKVRNGFCLLEGLSLSLGLIHDSIHRKISRQAFFGAFPETISKPDKAPATYCISATNPK